MGEREILGVLENEEAKDRMEAFFGKTPKPELMQALGVVYEHLGMEGIADLIIEKERKAAEENNAWKYRFLALRDLLIEAKRIYDEPNERQDAKLRKVARHLGFTSGKRGTSVNQDALWHEYLEMISGRIDWETFKVEEPLKPWDAIYQLTRQYEIASPDACLKHLQRKKRRIEAEAREAGDPCDLSGLLPTSWPTSRDK